MSKVRCYFTIDENVGLKKNEDICCILEAPRKIIKRVKAEARWSNNGYPYIPLIAVISKDLYKEILPEIKSEGLAVLKSETLANVILAPEKAISEIASKARLVLEQNGCQIQAVINAKVYNDLCWKHGIGNGFSL